MIRINLSTASKQSDLSNIGGLDLTRVKFKAVALALVVFYLPEIFLIDHWEQEKAKVNMVISEKQGNLSGLKRKVSQSQALEKQIIELRAQEENLGKKLTAVKQAISEKKNPASILLYIAQNIPPELWIQELTITSDSINVKGEALNYQSVGNFINSLKTSVFIRDANIIGTTSKVRETDRQRIETFEVKFGIARFEQ